MYLKIPRIVQPMGLRLGLCRWTRLPRDLRVLFYGMLPGPREGGESTILDVDVVVSVASRCLNL